MSKRNLIQSHRRAFNTDIDILPNGEINHIQDKRSSVRYESEAGHDEFEKNKLRHLEEGRKPSSQQNREKSSLICCKNIEGKIGAILLGGGNISDGDISEKKRFSYFYRNLPARVKAESPTRIFSQTKEEEEINTGNDRIGEREKLKNPKPKISNYSRIENGIIKREFKSRLGNGQGKDKFPTSQEIGFESRKRGRVSPLKTKFQELQNTLKRNHTHRTVISRTDNEVRPLSNARPASIQCDGSNSLTDNHKSRPPFERDKISGRLRTNPEKICREKCQISSGNYEYFTRRVKRVLIKILSLIQCFKICSKTKEEREYKIPSSLPAPSYDGRTTFYEGIISENPESELAQPPERNITESNKQDEHSRLLSFTGSLIPFDEASKLAKDGFFLREDGFVQCCSCSSFQRTHLSPVTELRCENLHLPPCEFIFSDSTRESAYLRQVVSDGKVSDDASDPPGQRSLYIVPGDIRSESYRLSTFEHFPVSCPKKGMILAKAGFYFTGYSDQVKCFACGRTVERWEERDHPEDARWHKPECPLPKGMPCGNVPIMSLLSRFHSAASPSQAYRQTQEQIIQQRDSNSGVIVREIRYPADLPDRVRRAGGTFEITSNNAVLIQSGPGLPIRNQNEDQPPRRWRMANVVSSNHRRFLANLYLNRELDRLTSFARWPVTRPSVPPAALARSGFFYLGDLDRTQCFSCGGVLKNWSLEDNAYEEHRTHFPQCAAVLGTEPRNVAIPEQAESEEQREHNYPCNLPSSPHMRNQAARVDTFDQRWPADRVRASIAEIGEAGFFYLGERDRVKCWYCNGGLQNWEWEDIPWNEHAKWFPNCQFLLRSKGQEFVHRHLALNPHLPRPIIARQEGSKIDPPGSETEESARSLNDVPPGGIQVRQPSPPPTNIDPQEEIRKKKERIDGILKNSELVKNVLMMGFSEKAVRYCIEERIDAGTEANTEDVYESVSSLLEAVMKKDAELHQEEEEVEHPTNMFSSIYSNSLRSIGSISSFGPSPGSGFANVSTLGNDEEAMDVSDIYGSMAGAVGGGAPTIPKERETYTKAQLAEAEEQRMCKVCFTEDANIVFIPCSHMCCCKECTQSLRHCPICRAKIEKAIMTYSTSILP